MSRFRHLALRCGVHNGRSLQRPTRPKRAAVLRVSCADANRFRKVRSRDPRGWLLSRRSNGAPLASTSTVFRATGRVAAQSLESRTDAWPGSRDHTDFSAGSATRRWQSGQQRSQIRVAEHRPRFPIISTAPTRTPRSPATAQWRNDSIYVARRQRLGQSQYHAAPNGHACRVSTHSRVSFQNRTARFQVRCCGTLGRLRFFHSRVSWQWSAIPDGRMAARS